MTSELSERAALFAKAAHNDKMHVRKYTGEPYWFHCREVARFVELVGGDEAMIAAAWLHDVVEDCGVSREALASEFGDDVADLVVWLTDVSRPEDGNRAVRKKIDREHLRNAPDRAQTVKLADLISNALSISIWDADFSKVYLKENERLLTVLQGGEPDLFVIARKTLELAQTILSASGNRDR